MNKNYNLCCASVDNVELTDNNTILNEQSTTYKNIFIYLSMSGDAVTGNASFTAKNIILNIDKDSKIKLTGDMYVSELNNDDVTNSSIDLNGYKLYVNNVEIK